MVEDFYNNKESRKLAEYKSINSKDGMNSVIQRKAESRKECSYFYKAESDKLSLSLLVQIQILSQRVC